MEDIKNIEKTGKKYIMFSLGTHFCCLHFAIMPLISNKNAELLESNWSNYIITIKWTNANVEITIVARNSVIMIKFPVGYSLLVDTVWCAPLWLPWAVFSDRLAANFMYQLSTGDLKVCEWMNENNDIFIPNLYVTLTRLRRSDRQAKVKVMSF